MIRRSELWIPATISLAISFRWLLGEQPSVFGDEAFHLTNLVWGFAGAAQGSLIDRLTSLYLFNFAYPPVFHMLAAPFVLSAADPVLGGRVYVQVVTLLVAVLLYIVTRRIGGPLAGTVAVATLLTTPSFVDVSRHYLLEPLLALQALLVLYRLGSYYESGRWRYVWMLAGVISAGLLTKFNFFLYAVPLFIAPAALEAYWLVRAPDRWPTSLRFSALIVAVPLVVAGPWYVARAVGSTSMLNSLYEGGTFTTGLTVDVLRQVIAVGLGQNYSPLVVIYLVAAAPLYAAYLLRVPFFRALVGR